MTPYELRRHQARMRRGRRWFFIICVVCLVVMALCLAACSPSLLRIEAPQNLRDAPVYVPPGKAPVQTVQSSSDSILQNWLDTVTGRKPSTP